jgi:hypothetical protein
LVVLIASHDKWPHLPDGYGSSHASTPHLQELFHDMMEIRIIPPKYTDLLGWIVGKEKTDFRRTFLLSNMGVSIAWA